MPKRKITLIRNPDSKEVRRFILKTIYKCTKCGKPVFSFNADPSSTIIKLMDLKVICWDCAYWDLFLSSMPDNIEIIGDGCYQVLPLVEKDMQTLTGCNKPKYILKKDGTAIKTNDIWWLNVIPPHLQQQLPPTAWWITKSFYDKLQRSQHQCYAIGCMDRYHCYRYKYQEEFATGPYNAVPRDWRPGDEHCPAFLPLNEITDYTEYTSVSDIIDEDSSEKIDDK